MAINHVRSPFTGLRIQIYKCNPMLANLKEILKQWIAIGDNKKISIHAIQGFRIPN